MKVLCASTSGNAYGFFYFVVARSLKAWLLYTVSV